MKHRDRYKSPHKGKPNARILKTFVEGGYEYSFHATKGWRRRSMYGQL